MYFTFVGLDVSFDQFNCLFFQCGENTGGMVAMPRGKLSKNEESYQKHMLFTPYIL